MSVIDNILLLTDFSDNASVAYQPAQELAERFDAKVDVIHVISDSYRKSGSAMAYGMFLDNVDDHIKKLEKNANSRLKSLMDEYISPPNRGGIILGVGTNVPRIIASKANSGEYDLMVMAKKGHHETQFLQGTITKKVMRFSHIPVITIDQDTIGAIDNVLVPTDGSVNSLKVLPLAISIALVFEANITLLYVLALQWMPMINELAKADKQRFASEILEDVKEVLVDADEITSLVEDEEGIKITQDSQPNQSAKLNILVEEDVSVPNHISGYANDKADLTVMATHGRSGVKRLMLGSVAEMVTQRVQRPIITVKPKI